MSETKKKHVPSIDDFLSENWEGLSPDERLASLKYAENQMAAKQGRTARTLQLLPDDKDMDGLFDPKTPNVLYIHKEFLQKQTDPQKKKRYSSYEALDTVYHEGRHAFQYDCVVGSLSGGIDEERRKLWQIVYQTEGFNDGSTFAQLMYRYSPLEDDAWTFALDEMKNWETIFYKDKAFYEYLDNRKAKNAEYERTGISEFGNDFRIILQHAWETLHEWRKDDEKEKKEKATEKQNSAMTAFSPVKETRRFSPFQLVLTGLSAAALVVLYFLARPSGFLQHLLWIIAVILPFLPPILLSAIKEGLPKPFRGRFGGILFLILYIILMILVVKIYKWLFIAYLVTVGFFMLKAFGAIAPSTLTIVREEADGTTSTETRIITEETADAEIAAAERQLRSEGYTIKK